MNQTMQELMVFGDSGVPTVVRDMQWLYTRRQHKLNCYRWRKACRLVCEIYYIAMIMHQRSACFFSCHLVLLVDVLIFVCKTP
jgi:hypothetical protein